MDKIALQKLCREYLSRLRYMADKHGLGGWLSEIITANRRGECEATEKEVTMLSRLCDDERIARKDIPALIGKSYRECESDGTFNRIKTLKRVGIYGKVSAMLEKERKH